MNRTHLTATGPQDLETLQRMHEAEATTRRLLPLPDFGDESSEEEEEVVEYADPSHDPFQFIRAVQNGRADFLEFVYLTPRLTKSGERISYNLAVIPSTMVDRSDYYTLGLSGVCHFKGGATEFTWLGRWQYEFGVFGQIRKLPFFRKFRRFKAYFLWRGQVRRTKCRRARQQLQERLCLVSPVLRSAVLETIDVCGEAELLRLFLPHGEGQEADPDLHARPTQMIMHQAAPPVTLEEFHASQVHHQDHVRNELSSISGRLARIVSQACEQEMDAVLDSKHTATQKFRGRQAMQTETFLRKRKMLPRSTHGEGDVVAGGRLSYTQIVTKRAVCARLNNFVRLCDFIVMFSMRRLAHAGANDLVESLSTPFLEVQKTEEDITVTNARQARQLERDEARPLDMSTDSDWEEVDLREEEEALEMERARLGEDAGGPGWALTAVVVRGESRKQRRASSLQSEIEQAEHGHRRASKVSKAGSKLSLWEEQEEEQEEDDHVAPFLKCQLMLKIEPGSSSAELELVPGRRELQEVVESILESYKGLVHTVTRLVDHDSLLPYTAPQFNDRPPEPFGSGFEIDVRRLLTMDEVYQDYILEAKDELEGSFHLIRRHLARYQVWGERYLANQAYNAQEALSHEGKLGFFRRSIKKYQDENVAIENLPSNVVIGRVDIGLSRLKATVAPTPRLCIQGIHARLPVLAREQTKALNVELAHFILTLEQDTNSVAEFVASDTVLETVSSRIESMFEAYDTLRELYDIIDDNEIAVEPEEIAEFKTVSPSLSQLVDIIEGLTSRREERTFRYNAELEAMIEELFAEMTVIKNDSFAPLLSDTATPCDEALSWVINLDANLEALLVQSDQFTEWQLRFNPREKSADYEELDAIMNDVKSKRELWQAVSDLHEASLAWNRGVFHEADIPAIDGRIREFRTLANRAHHALPNNSVVPMLQEDVESWQKALPVLHDLKSDSLESWHWEEIESIVGVDMQRLIKRHALLEEVVSHDSMLVEAEKLHSIIVTAMEEKKLNLMMKGIEETWQASYFLIEDYKPESYNSVYVLGEVDEVAAALDDSLTTVGAILNSRYVARIRDKVSDWERKLQRTSDCIGAWTACQGKWVYLESVFNSPDIASKLPNEDKNFKFIDKWFRETMRKIKGNSLAIKVGTTPTLLEMLQSSNEKLEVVSRNLEAYLEMKRLSFPRFNFLSDYDLVDILSKAKAPHTVQPHMSKMFAGVQAIEIRDDDDEMEVVGVLSLVEERIVFEKPVLLTIGAVAVDVQRWMTKAEEQIVATLQKLTQVAVKEYIDDELHVFAVHERLPAMCVLVAMQVHWATLSPYMDIITIYGRITLDSTP